MQAGGRSQGSLELQVKEQETGWRRRNLIGRLDLIDLQRAGARGWADDRMSMRLHLGSQHGSMAAWQHGLPYCVTPELEATGPGRLCTVGCRRRLGQGARETTCLGNQVTNHLGGLGG